MVEDKGENIHQRLIALLNGFSNQSSGKEQLAGTELLTATAYGLSSKLCLAASKMPTEAPQLKIIEISEPIAWSFNQL